MLALPFSIESLPGEAWRPLTDTDDYRISNFGRLASRKGYGSCRWNCWHIINSHRRGKGHYLVAYIGFGSELSAKLKYIHDLVATAFIGERPAGLVVNHKDGNKLNNHVSNIEYVTQGENVRHAHRIGLIPRKSRRVA